METALNNMGVTINNPHIRSYVKKVKKEDTAMLWSGTRRINLGWWMLLPTSRSLTFIFRLLVRPIQTICLKPATSSQEQHKTWAYASPLWSYVLYIAVQLPEADRPRWDRTKSKGRHFLRTPGPSIHTNYQGWAVHSFGTRATPQHLLWTKNSKQAVRRGVSTGSGISAMHSSSFFLFE